MKMHLNSSTVCTEKLTEFMKSHFPNTCLKVSQANASRRGFQNPFKLTQGDPCKVDILCHTVHIDLSSQSHTCHCFQLHFLRAGALQFLVADVTSAKELQ